jgi:hypothetical protein
MGAANPPEGLCRAHFLFFLNADAPSRLILVCGNQAADGDLE